VGRDADNRSRVVKNDTSKVIHVVRMGQQGFGISGEAYITDFLTKNHFGQKEIPEEVVKKLRPESRNWQCRGFKDDELKTAIDRLKGMIKQDAESKAEGYQI
jgi:hypothetical protein